MYMFLGEYGFYSDVGLGMRVVWVATVVLGGDLWLKCRGIWSYLVCNLYR
jgi:hypothetical protein